VKFKDVTIARDNGNFVELASGPLGYSVDIVLIIGHGPLLLFKGDSSTGGARDRQPDSLSRAPTA
jgi:hypothetical protein